VLGGAELTLKAAAGFDIDGTLTEDNGVSNIWDVEIEKYFGVKRRTPSYDFRDAFGLTDSDIKLFYRDRVPDIYTSVPLKDGSVEVIDSLKRAGIGIYLVTARDSIHSDVTERYLAKHGLEYDAIYYTDDKLQVCEDLGIQFFADDRAENCLSLSSAGVLCVMVNAFHNLHIDYNPRAANWNQIGEIAFDAFGLIKQIR
jgi:uncharacterized HAD superfamily protein